MPFQICRRFHPRQSTAKPLRLDTSHILANDRLLEIPARLSPAAFGQFDFVPSSTHDAGSHALRHAAVRVQVCTRNIPAFAVGHSGDALRRAAEAVASGAPWRPELFWWASPRPPSCQCADKLNETLRRCSVRDGCDNTGKTPLAVRRVVLKVPCKFPFVNAGGAGGRHGHTVRAEQPKCAGAPARS